MYGLKTINNWDITDDQIKISFIIIIKFILKYIKMEQTAIVTEDFSEIKIMKNNDLCY